MQKTLNMSDNNKTVVQANNTNDKDITQMDKQVVEQQPITKDKDINNVKIELSKNKRKKFNWKVLIFPIVAILTLSGIAAFYYFEIYKLVPINEVISFNDNYVKSNTTNERFLSSLPSLAEPEEPRTEESPLNGLLFTKTQMDYLKARRPVAVMINNHVQARPQSGLNSADIVYETLAESGITRFMAIFWSEAPEKVGSIRSLRQYYLEWLSEYDPILIHDGCADTDNVLTNACGNSYKYGIKDIATLGAWRWNDGVRYAPHNEYSSITNAWVYAEKMEWNSFPDIGKWSFKKDASIDTLGSTTTVSIKFHTGLDNGGLYDVIWTYNKITNTYLRKTAGKIDVDQETNTQVYTKNLVIQYINMKLAGDDKGRVIITTIGSGNADILLDGKVIHGTWKKESRTSRTMYYDESGNLVEFNRGKIWVAAVPTTVGEVTYGE